MKDLSKFLNSPSGAILLGAVIISLSILISGGVIKTKGVTTTQPSAVAGNNPSAAGQAPSAPTPPAKVNISLGHFPVKGNDSAKVAVVEFADLRCPFCEQFYTNTEPQLLKDYVDTGKVKFAFRQYEFLGAASTTAGNAAECANEQGKFWDMYDYLYKNQPPENDTSMYTTDKLTSVATSLGMDGSKFQSCLSSTKYANNLTTDQQEGSQAGISGTPSFVIGKLDSTGTKIVDGQLVVGAVPYDSLKSTIDQALQ